MVSTKDTAKELRILFADPDHDFSRVIRETLKKGLSEYNLQIVYTDDGESAIKLFDEHNPQIFITEIMLPGLNGWEVGKYIRDKCQKNKVERPLMITLTSIGPSLNELTSPLYGFTCLLDKPVNLDDLIDCIKKNLQIDP